MSRAIQLAGYGKGPKVLKTRQGTRGGQASFLPTDLPGLVAWFRFNTGITVTGSGVSKWADVSGNGNDLLQSEDAKRPFKTVSDGSVNFDGVNEYLKTAPFTLIQPYTIYLLVNQLSITNNDRFFDGESVSATLRQRISANRIAMSAGTTGTNHTGLPVGSYGIVVTIFNGVSSFLNVNNLTEDIGDCGLGVPGGLTVGSRADESQSCHMELKEFILYNSAHVANQRNKVIPYLNEVGGGVF